MKMHKYLLLLLAAIGFTGNIAGAASADTSRAAWSAQKPVVVDGKIVDWVPAPEFLAWRQADQAADGFTGDVLTVNLAGPFHTGAWSQHAGALFNLPHQFAAGEAFILRFKARSLEGPRFMSVLRTWGGAKPWDAIPITADWSDYAVMLTPQQETTRVTFSLVPRRDGLQPYCAGRFELSAVALVSPRPDTAPFAIRNGDRVVFYGDSITDSEWYPTIIESFVLTRFPVWRNQFSNRGVSGDNSGSIARFERDVIAQHPDVCTYNMGFNDGGYFAVSSAGLEKWLANIEKSVALARKADPEMRMVLLSPIPNEASVSLDPRWVSREVYPYAMLSFGAEEAKLAERLGMPFIDIGLLYGQSMGLGKVVAGASFNLSRDGVHPQREGQAIIAYHLLKGLGADPLVSSAIIDAAQATVVDARRCKVTNLATVDGTISFSRACESLPCPLPPEARPFAFLLRFDDTLNADLLAVKGLVVPAYTLLIDDRKIADISSAELAAGVNLSRYQNTPMNEQATQILDVVRKKQILEYEFFRTWIFIGKADGAGQPTDKADVNDRTAMDNDRKAIADATVAAYAINSPKAHTFRLVPSTAKVGRFDFIAAADIAQPRLDVVIDPLATDWNRLAITGQELNVTVKNPGTIPRSGLLRWRCGNGWTITPAELAFTVEAGKETRARFTVTAAEGTALVPPPSLDMSWRWSNNWAYPLTVVREVQLAPRLAIARSTRKPTFTGTLDDWEDATSFPLDAPYFVDPAVVGKRLLWGGTKDLSGQFYFKWDDTAFYVAALVRDDEHLQHASKMMAWSQDCLMLMFSMKETALYDQRHEFIFAASEDNTEVIETIGAGKCPGPEIAFASHLDVDKGTCLYEVAVPWARIGAFVPAPEKSFRCSVSVSDADTQPGKGFNYLSWTPGIQYGKYPADLATIILMPGK